MKKILFYIFLIITKAQAQNFEIEAKTLVKDIKTSLMKNLSTKMAKDGAVAAIPFCHKNVKPIAQKSANKRITKYEFGRTSHKIRNPQNAPQLWAEKYLHEFKGKLKKDIKEKYIIHRLKNAKRIYLEPLYIQSKCLTCHGKNIPKPVRKKLNALYPNDKATGFIMGEFRGFIWIKEK